MKNKLSRRFFIMLWIPALCAFMSGCAHADLPPFDYEKAKHLSIEKHREYDVIFFNEVVVWNMNSNRYGSRPEDSSIGRDAEFRGMAEAGYLPAYVALRLLDIRRGSERNDPKAVAMLLKAAEAGDASAMCAFAAISINSYEESSYAERSARRLQMVERGFALRHPACMINKAAGYLFGLKPGVSQDLKAAMPLLMESARQGYYGAVSTLFGLRYGKALAQQFDFTDLNEFKRALCWGRLAEQHTNWASFDYFLGLLKDYARINNRPDLLELSAPYDPRLVPITQIVVKPEDCIQLEEGE